MAEAVGYGIDSRTIGAGELFFAVRGERLDGHDLCAAGACEWSSGGGCEQSLGGSSGSGRTRLLQVSDCDDCVLGALQRLAHAVRREWGGRVIGVTGSAGKTTTKEAVAQVLGAKFKVLKSAGNLNNAFGLPLQLLKLEREHEVAVIEMGMNHAGEIAALAKIAEPNWAVVSNVAPVHLEFFPDGIAGIARAKYELIEALPKDGVAILNFDDPYVRVRQGMGRACCSMGWAKAPRCGRFMWRRWGLKVWCLRWRQGGARQRAIEDARKAQCSERAGGDCSGAAKRDET